MNDIGDMAGREEARVPRVSVVIPTDGRRDWKPTVRSAFQQKDVTVEVLLVNNGKNDIADDAEFPGLRILRSSPEHGANGARQAGVEHARHELIALLDDDDTWEPSKLRTQLDFIERQVEGGSEEYWICGAGQIIHEEGRPSILAPGRFDAGVTDAATYLFRRDTVRSRFHQLQSSTLVFPRPICLAVPFRPELRLHQDWTWILDVEEKLGAAIYVCPEYLVHYQRALGSSISGSMKAVDSLAWADVHLAGKSKRIRGDFLLTVPFSLAVESGRTGLAILIFLKAVAGTRPGVPAMLRGPLLLLRAFLGRVSRG